ncbi:hypothetical protein [Ottowia sp.]|uniref:hypothetical protein n=1 Tax=Ottowia sp. TaxID=1898956 RepID=UPI003A84695A
MKKSMIASFFVAAGALLVPVAGWTQGAAAVAVEGSAPGARLKGGEIELRAKIVELDLKNRIATLRNPQGQIVILNVPASVQNLDQVQAGDDLVFRYTAAVVAKLEKVTGQSGIRERVENNQQVNAPAGALPGTADVRTVDVLAKITALNAKARTVTLRGATRTTTLALPEDLDIKTLKVGDEVRATIIEAAVLDIERPAS